MPNSNLKLQITLALLLLILSIRFYFFYHNQPRYEDGQQVSFKTVLLSEPRVFGSQQVFTADLASNQRIRIITSRFPEFHYGENIRVSGSIRVLPRAREGQPYGSSTQQSEALISSNNILMNFPIIETVDSSSVLQTSLEVVSNVRQQLISLFSKTLPSPSSSLLMGIIFGIKESMPKDFADNLKTSRVFHVIAASGMNVTLIGGFINNFFAFFLKRQIALGISIVGIIFYALLGGLEPSIIRAGIMGILVFSAQIIGRQTLAVNGLFLAGFVMLFIAPSLVFDIGFQLSFVATLGILYIKPIPATIAAQIATLPILMANFGSYSIYSILVNGLVLWTVPILMAIGAIGAIVGLILVPLGQTIIYFCYPLLWYFENIVNFFGKFGVSITVQVLPWQFILGYYCVLFSILLIMRRKE